MEAVEDVLQVGQQVEVEVEEIDDRGKLSLIAVVDEETAAAEAAARAESRESRRGRSPRGGSLHRGDGDGTGERRRTRSRRRRGDGEESTVGEDAAAPAADESGTDEPTGPQSPAASLL